ncbi:PHT4 [Scenedesmus sp. PABB004]|nr:PHT4 [Scenedesmus sp. PABB004]
MGPASAGAAAGAMVHPRLRHGVAAAAAGGPGPGPGTSLQPQPPAAPSAPPSRSGSKDLEAALPGAPGGGEPGNPSWLTLVLVAAAGVVICYADRSNMSTAILPMAEAFNWDKAFEGVVLSAFFAGYAATQVLGGSLADRYGGKLVLTAGVFLWSVFTVATPAAAAAGTPALLAARVLLGVGEGVAFPSIHSIIARNVPPSKRSTAVGVVTAASYAGTALAFGISPLLISRLGWQWVFYLFGASALLWLPVWLPLNVQRELAPPGGAGAGAGAAPAGGSGSGGAAACGGAADADAPPAPAGAGGGGEEEGQPLLARASFEIVPGAAAAAASAAAAGAPPRGPRAAPGTGFAALMRRREVWAICACQYAQSYGMYGLLTWLPTFFSDYYHVEVGDLGGYTLLPYVVQGLVGLGAGALADSLLATRGWGVRRVRAASAFITLGLGLSALSLGAVSVNHLDIAPRHAGMVFGAGNTAATLAGLVSVPLTGLLLERTGSWALVFGIIGAHFVAGSAAWAAWVGDTPLPEDGPDDGGAAPGRGRALGGSAAGG